MEIDTSIRSVTETPLEATETSAPSKHPLLGLAKLLAAHGRITKNGQTLPAAAKTHEAAMPAMPNMVALQDLVNQA